MFVIVVKELVENSIDVGVIFVGKYRNREVIVYFIYVILGIRYEIIFILYLYYVV